MTCPSHLRRWLVVLGWLILPALLGALPLQPKAVAPSPPSSPPMQWQLDDLLRQNEPGALKWLDDFEQALSLAARQSKALLVYFTSPFCGWCKRLDVETLQTAEVRKHLADCVLVKIDTLQDEKVAARFRVRGTPTLLFLSPEGRETLRLSGYVEPAAFLQTLAEVLGHQFHKKNEKLEGLIRLLGANQLPAASWPDVVLALPDERHREVVTRLVAELKPAPRKELVALLEHPLLAVRVGALELLEELAGDDFGFSPWLDQPPQNAEALARWKDWAVKHSEAPATQLHKALSEDEVASYLRDLIGDDSDRAARARRMLERGGASSLDGVDAFLRAHPELPTGALHKLREVRYSLMLPVLSGTDPGNLAHRLVFGNLDLRLRTLRDIAAARARAVPVIQDFLASSEPLVRETAVDALVTAGGRKMVPLLEDHLKREKDLNVIYIILKQLGRLPSKRGLAVLTSHLDNPNEDLVVIALESIGRLKSDTVSAEVGKRLGDPRWRVRVAALKAAQALRLGGLARQITNLLTDPDEFVRASAVEALGAVAAKEAVPQLEALFQKDDALKGPIIKALCAADAPVSEGLVKALAAKEPSVLLGVLDPLESADLKLAPLLEALARHPDADVSCAALRLICGHGLAHSRLQQVAAEQLRTVERRRLLTILESVNLEDAVLYRYHSASQSVNFELPGTGLAARPKTDAERELDAVFGAFEGKPAVSAPKSPAGPAGAEDVFKAFETAGGTGENFFETFLKAGQQALQQSADPELRLVGARFLAHLGDVSALPVVEQHLEQMTIEQRDRLAAHLRRLRNQSGLGLVRRLLADPAAEVRRNAAESLMHQGANEQCVDLLFAELLRPGTPLSAHEVHEAVQSPARNRSMKSALQRHARQLLDTARNDHLITFALIVLKDAWDSEAEPLVLRHAQAVNPWHRRAALYALGRNDRKRFEAEVDRVARDPSEYVRVAVPVLYAMEDGNLYWQHHFTEDKTSIDYNLDTTRRGNAVPLPDHVRQVLRTLASDPSDRVRFEAAYCLLTHQDPIDLSGLASVLDKFARDSEAVRRISTYLARNYKTLGRNFSILLPYYSAENIYPVVSEETLYEHFGATAETEDLKTAWLPGRTRARVEASYLNAPPPRPPARTLPENLKLVFFVKPGCPLCDLVQQRIENIREAFPELTVLQYDINKSASLLVNEALAEKFHVPASVRLVAPTVFTGAGYLVKEDITMDRLGSLLARAASVPVADWLKLPQTELAAAQANIVQRYHQTGAGLILAAGLLDGINPCAFATIIFLLSYLQVTRKQPRDIARIGLSYILGVFAAYYVIGMGLLKITVMVAQLRWAGRGLNYAMGAFALGIMVLSIRDGIRCLQGRMQEMTLQLPGFLKSRIHGMIRAGVRQAHFVLVAFFMGVAISFMELACTGQVYLPTITYMVQSGEQGALWQLAVYNLAFILPLTLVFVLAYAGLKSETLLALMKRRAALVKFSTALLFFLIFLFLVFGHRLQA